MVTVRTSKCGSVWVTTNVMVSENPEIWACMQQQLVGDDEISASLSLYKAHHSRFGDQCDFCLSSLRGLVIVFRRVAGIRCLCGLVITYG